LVMLAGAAMAPMFVLIVVMG
jgi:hypothetical protein